MKIKIEDHPNGLISDVKLIRIDGVGAGYCGTVEGSPICLTSRQPQAVRLLVQQAVEKSIGGCIGSINEPPPQEETETEESLNDGKADDD